MVRRDRVGVKRTGRVRTAPGCPSPHSRSRAPPALALARVYHHRLRYSHNQPGLRCQVTRHADVGTKLALGCNRGRETEGKGQRIFLTPFNFHQLHRRLIQFIGGVVDRDEAHGMAVAGAGRRRQACPSLAPFTSSKISTSPTLRRIFSSLATAGGAPPCVDD